MSDRNLEALTQALDLINGSTADVPAILHEPARRALAREMISKYGVLVTHALNESDLLSLLSLTPGEMRVALERIAKGEG